MDAADGLDECPEGNKPEDQLELTAGVREGWNINGWIVTK